MLLRFKAGNHLSLREPQELSMVASAAIKDDASGLIDCKAVGEQLVPAAVIYGANASGKSNVVRALQSVALLVLRTYEQSKYGLYESPAHKHAPFALEPTASKKVSSFEIDFVVGGVRYDYGFDRSDETIEFEWLDAYPRGRRMALFFREGARFKFGRGLRGQNVVTGELTRRDNLFLSVARQFNHEQLAEVADFFRRLIVEVEIQPVLGQAEEPLDARVVEFLERADTGIVSSRLAESAQVITLPSASLHGITRLKELQLGHRGSAPEPIYLRFDQESSGTQRLVRLLRHAYRALDSGSVFVVDEIDASLHTQVCEAILALFSSRKTNPKGAQLIATTHDTNLLRSPYLRRDQVWFTEKDEHGATHLFPLTDIATRQGENIEKGYLHGRFGAVPFAGSVSDLVAGE